MAFIDCTIYHQPLSVNVIYRDGDSPLIQTKCGNGYIAMDPAEAARLRDDLSRAIVEAAQASAKAVESEGSPA